MTDNTNGSNDNTETTPKAPRVVKHRDEKIKDLREDIVELQARIAKKEELLSALTTEAENEESIANLAAGDAITFAFGRAATRRVQSGVVRAVQRTDGNVLLKVETGEGFDAQLVLIDAGAVLLTGEQVEAEEARIAAAKAKAEEEAAAEAAGGEA